MSDSKPDKNGDHGPKLIGFLVVPKFPLLAFSSALEPFRAANRLSGKTLYEWRIFTPDNQPVRASNDLEVVPDIPTDDARSLLARTG